MKAKSAFLVMAFRGGTLKKWAFVGILSKESRLHRRISRDDTGFWKKVRQLRQPAWFYCVFHVVFPYVFSRINSHKIHKQKPMDLAQCLWRTAAR